jgi:hypothetical protein
MRRSLRPLPRRLPRENGDGLRSVLRLRVASALPSSGKPRSSRDIRVTVSRDRADTRARMKLRETEYRRRTNRD